MSISKKGTLVQLGATALLCGLVYLLQRRSAASLAEPAYASGLILLTLLVVLALFSLRKKLDFLPLGRAVHWAQMHYLGGMVFLFTLVLHTSGGLPSGIFESLLFWVIWGALVTGVFGLYWSRTFPARMNKRGEGSIFERIPRLRLALQKRAEALVMTALAEKRALEQAKFYHDVVRPFLMQARDGRAHLMNNDQPFRHWDGVFSNLRTQLQGKDADILDGLRAVVRQKIDLDHQYAHLALLKYWLFVHIPLALGSLVLVTFHLLLVYSFGGSQ